MRDVYVISLIFLCDVKRNKSSKNKEYKVLKEERTMFWTFKLTLANIMRSALWCRDTREYYARCFVWFSCHQRKKSNEIKKIKCSKKKKRALDFLFDTRKYYAKRFVLFLSTPANITRGVLFDLFEHPQILCEMFYVVFDIRKYYARCFMWFRC